MDSKILALLGFASKAGKLSYGMNNTVNALKSGVSRLVLAAEDTSDKSKKELIFHADKFGTESVVLDGVTADDLSHAVGRQCSVLSVNDTGFADAIKQNGKTTH